MDLHLVLKVAYAILMLLCYIMFVINLWLFAKHRDCHAGMWAIIYSIIVNSHAGNW